MLNDDESSIRSGTKPQILMEFSRRLAAARQCRVYQKQGESVLFKCHPSICLPRSSSSSYAYYAYPLSLSLALLPLYLSFVLSIPRLARYHSLAARKIVSRDCQKYALRTHLTVRLHLSVRCRS